jgi:hypothetical protein
MEKHGQAMIFQSVRMLCESSYVLFMQRHVVTWRDLLLTLWRPCAKRVAITEALCLLATTLTVKYLV